MKDSLNKTHIGFDIEPNRWSSIIADVRNKLGNNDYLQEYHLRPWITDGHTLYIRNDLANHDSFATYLGLISKFNK